VGVEGRDVGERVKHKNFHKNTFNIHFESWTRIAPVSHPSAPATYLHIVLYHFK